MSTFFSLQSAVRRSLACAVVAGSAFAIASAQTAPADTGSAGTAQSVAFQLPATAPLANVQDALFSSSSAYNSSADAGDAASNAAQMNLASLEKGINLPDLNPQYGRRRYGRPRYRGGNSNGDGSEKYTFFVGGGFTVPLGNTHKYDTPSWGFQVGAGRNFNKNVGVDLQFDWDNFGLQGSNLTQQSYVDDPLNQYGIQGLLDGYSHVWSLTVDPIYNIPVSEGLGAYLTAGVGFYHKITTFTIPNAEEYCDPYYGCYDIEANEPIDSYTSNSAGVNGGFGFTYKFSRFANERLYGEVRYVVTFNAQKSGINGSNYNDYATGGYDYPTPNLYPANSNRSTYLPVKFGIRF